MICGSCNQMFSNEDIKINSLINFTIKTNDALISLKASREILSGSVNHDDDGSNVSLAKNLLKKNFLITYDVQTEIVSSMVLS